MRNFATDSSTPTGDRDKALRSLAEKRLEFTTAVVIATAGAFLLVLQGGTGPFHGLAWAGYTAFGGFCAFKGIHAWVQRNKLKARLGITQETRAMQYHLTDYFHDSAARIKANTRAIFKFARERLTSN